MASVATMEPGWCSRMTPRPSPAPDHIVVPQSRHRPCRAPVMDSFPEGGRGPVDKTSHELARRGSECVKAAVNVQKERGRALEIECREAVARGAGETKGNQAQTEAKYADDNNVSHVPPLRVPPCDARADHGHSLTNGGWMSTPIAWPGGGA